MKRLRIGLGICLLSAILMAGAPIASAITAIPYTPSPALEAPPVIITAYASDGRDIMYVQLFNKTGDVVDLSGWQLEYRLAEETIFIPLVQLGGMIKPASYILAAESDAVEEADIPYKIYSIQEAPLNDLVLRLVPAQQFKNEEMNPLVGGEPSYWQRNISEITGNFLSTFSKITPDESYTLYTGGLYEAAQSTGLQISEILANPRDCSPIDISMDCRDYVKLFNPTTTPIDLSLFRLRSGFQGQSSTSSNSLALEGFIQPGHYLPIGESEENAISLTSTGGYVWLEDIFGVRIYDTTVQNFPDASSDTRKGQSWAYNQVTDSWQWSSHPTPENAPNVFPVVSISTSGEEDDDRVPCNANQYRSPETGRCRLLTVSESSTLAPCPPGQYRNEATNRCRTLTLSSGLAPCDSGEERNPATNRCRKVALGAESSLVPCKENQERNPETNRCRNKVAAVTSNDVPFPVERASDGEKEFIGWWVLGLMAAAGAAYGMWEWRYEFLAVARRIFPVFK